MDINLNLLRPFYHVVEAGSFSEAARRLHVTQPAVSKAVRELENQLDLPLIERGPAGLAAGRALQLTDNGRAVYEHARAIFALERSAVEDIRARLGLQRGQLRVGASTTIAGYWLPPVVARFLQLHPDVELSIVSGNTQTISQALLDCRVDVALVEGSVVDPRIQATLWRQDTLQILAPPDSAIAKLARPSLHQLNQQTWLQREPGSGTRESMDEVLRRLQITPAHRVELSSSESIARTVAAGAGLALLPTVVVRELHQLGQVAFLPAPKKDPLLRPLFHLQLKQRPASPLAVAFEKILAAEAEGAV